MKFHVPGDNAAGQKFCEEHHKYYGPRNKYKTCPDCGYGSYKDFEESQEDFDINNPEELAR